MNELKQSQAAVRVARLERDLETQRVKHDRAFEAMKAIRKALCLPNAEEREQAIRGVMRSFETNILQPDPKKAGA